MQVECDDFEIGPIIFIIHTLLSTNPHPAAIEGIDHKWDGIARSFHISGRFLRLRLKTKFDTHEKGLPCWIICLIHKL